MTIDEIVEEFERDYSPHTGYGVVRVVNSEKLNSWLRTKLTNLRKEWLREEIYMLYTMRKDEYGNLRDAMGYLFYNSALKDVSDRYEAELNEKV